MIKKMKIKIRKMKSNRLEILLPFNGNFPNNGFLVFFFFSLKFFFLLFNVFHLVEINEI